MPKNVERASVFGENGIGFDDETYIIHGDFDPRISPGQSAPNSTIFIYVNGINSTLLQKRGSLDTDWEDITTGNGSVEFDGLVLDNDLCFIFTNDRDVVVV